VLDVKFSPDGSSVAAGTEEGTWVFYAESGSVQSHVASRGLVPSVAFSPDGQFVAAGGNNHLVQVFRVSGTNEDFHLTGQGLTGQGSFRSVVLDPAAHWIAVVDDRAKAEILDLRSGKEAFDLASPERGQECGRVQSERAAPRRRRILTAWYRY
jgi:WD40 repeat protein